MFWKQTTVKILVYTVKARLCYSCFRVKGAKVVIKMIGLLFPVAGPQQLMVTHVCKTLNSWILFCKTCMATENCYYKKLLKARLITSKQVPSLLFLQRYVQPQYICTEHFKFSKVISLMYSSQLLVIYFPELYISTDLLLPPSKLVLANSISRRIS